jgi:hypothetical protein
MHATGSKKLGRRLLKHGITGALAAGPFVLVVLWLMLHHKPGWYRPVALDEAGLQLARDDATTMADDISDRIVMGDAFDLALRARAVNEWLAGLSGFWPEVEQSIPPELTDPAMGFEPGCVRVGALYTGQRWRAIISAGLSVRLSGDARSIEIALKDIRGGSLPAPRAVLGRLIDPLLERARDRSSDEERSPLESALRDVRSVDDLFKGVKVRNDFVWPNGERPFRIDSIKINDGELTLRIEPL